jgi:hypothetical protein
MISHASIVRSAGGPSWWRSTIDWFATHTPERDQRLAAAEIAAGLWLARQQETETAAWPYSWRFDIIDLSSN